LTLDELADRAADAERRRARVPAVTAPASPMAQFKLRPLAEMLRDRTLPVYDIHGLLERGSTCMKFGAPASGKSFLMVHAAFAVGSGQPFFGRATRQTAVVIFAGEGHRGLARRLAACAQVHGFDPERAQVFVSSASFGANVLAEAEVAAAELRRIEHEHGVEIGLIFVDTVAAHIRGDENLAEVVTAFLSVLRLCFGDRTIVLVHHTGHTAADRARGSSAFRGAVDSEFQVKREGSAVTVSCLKMKDGPEPEPMNLELVGVALDGWPPGDDGLPVTSAVLRPGRVPAPSDARGAPKGTNQSVVLDAVRTLRAENAQRLADGGIAHGNPRVRVEAARERTQLPRNRWHEAVESLSRANLIRVDRHFIEIVDLDSNPPTGAP
jgi:hypothetical protein